MIRIYPKVYIESLNKKRKNKGIMMLIIPAFSFSLTFLFLSPILHESIHMLVLNSFNLYYKANLKFDLISGVHGLIKVFSPIDVIHSVILLLSGVIGSFSIASFLFLLRRKFHNKGFMNYLLLMMSFGFYLDSFFNLSVGDVGTVLQMFGLGTFSSFLPIFSFSLFLFLIPKYWKEVKQSYSLLVVSNVKQTQVI